MGGFAALSNSHLAHHVVVFGPQTELWPLLRQQK